MPPRRKSVEKTHVIIPLGWDSNKNPIITLNSCLKHNKWRLKAQNECKSRRYLDIRGNNINFAKILSILIICVE